MGSGESWSVSWPTTILLYARFVFIKNGDHDHEMTDDDVYSDALLIRMS